MNCRALMIVVGMTLCGATMVQGQTLERIIADIYGQLTEDDAENVDYEQLYDDLIELATNPIDLNNATDEQLMKLPFLNQRQRDDIRYFAYMYGGFHSTEELQLVSSLASYDIRNITPFVRFEKRIRNDSIQEKKWRDGLTEKIRHTATVRGDYRSSTDVSPYYITARYQLSSQGKLKIGVNATKYAGQQWDKKGFNHYGLYAELTDLNKIVHRIAIGDYRADYGAGLVIGSQWMSSVSQLMTSSRTRGIRARSSASQSGTYLRGAGIELKPTENYEIAVFYSFRHNADRDTNQHIAGLHTAYNWKHFTLGATVTGRFASALKDYSDRIYTANYARGTKTFTAGINYSLTFKNVNFNGEFAATPNGVATFNTLTLTPAARLRIVMSQRYYSPHFDNPYAHAFSRYSRLNDELGLYLGMQWNINSDWMLRAYADGNASRFTKSRIYQPTTGFEYAIQTIGNNGANNFDIRLRWRRSEENYDEPDAPTRHAENVDKAQIRFIYSRSTRGFSCATQVHGTLAKRQHSRPTLGAALTQRLSYTMNKFSVSAQFTAFQATDYNNRIYVYERDVLYAFSMPVLQGTGARYTVNMSWRIIPQLTMQMSAAQTIYAQTTSSNKRPFTIRLQMRFNI